MSYIRVLFSLLLAILGGWISKGNIEIAFLYKHPVIERSGIVNVLSGYGCLSIGLYLALFWLKDQFGFPLNIGKANKVIAGLIVISLILSVMTFSAINRQIDGYVECKDQRKLSSRYSSRTYAISQERCESLEVK
ncbi:hypothetical protein GCM10007938_39910 [Vibrio zhanjiangensis]|uniref:DUF1240 domain-containing protein n=1 Tax=Vibrio zhanjiangensis TaxID=1046128 RepID=A0ABQ6F3W2_9VIBR|nr:hypothetical protein [Vibrio zhanjiangensis]GLT20208.1 hypothetical protein GCM10007938_39910 [Vibrio zhanjiangensis]